MASLDTTTSLKYQSSWGNRKEEERSRNESDQQIGLGLWCLTPFSKIFKLYRGGNRSTRKKTTDIASHWQTLSHNVIRVHLAMNGARTHNFSGDRHKLHR